VTTALDQLQQGVQVDGAVAGKVRREGLVEARVKETLAPPSA